MKRLVTLLIVVVVLPFILSSCSKDNESQILGIWVSDQASQKVGSDEVLSQFNYLEIKEGNITLGNYVNEIKDDITVKNITKSDEKMKYEWRSKKKISINSSLYEIELKNDEMIIKNENIEIHYNKEK
ncbi:hypothetical protein EHS13_16750 [Paenibacillus psychroresistens]|uniref:Lipocalin-like domain-containing protein n=1 Tax=Paenibacillus psychroresistens TaxID=1778678 RepID=A0A6B8RKY5_9BACL|nr:hypothetical protein [Paenibacillus psychroresistens]QGQ96414.1 hypothetical protein EHS13_16750 [Paenibacillus psychroresistens]